RGAHPDRKGRSTMSPAIEADHYRDEVERLKKDPIVIAMANELWDAPQHLKDQFWNSDAEPTSHFMNVCNLNYNAKVAKDPTAEDNHHSIGGVAKAITALHKERVENQ